MLTTILACSQPVADLDIENINDILLIATVPNDEAGWYDTYYNGQNYFVPSANNIEEFYFHYHSKIVFTLQGDYIHFHFARLCIAVIRQIV